MFDSTTQNILTLEANLLREHSETVFDLAADLHKAATILTSKAYNLRDQSFVTRKRAFEHQSISKLNNDDDSDENRYVKKRFRRNMEGATSTLELKERLKDDLENLAYVFGSGYKGEQNAGAKFSGDGTGTQSKRLFMWICRRSEERARKKELNSSEEDELSTEAEAASMKEKMSSTEEEVLSKKKDMFGTEEQMASHKLAMPTEQGTIDYGDDEDDWCGSWHANDASDEEPLYLDSPHLSDSESSVSLTSPITTSKFMPINPKKKGPEPEFELQSPTTSPSLVVQDGNLLAWIPEKVDISREAILKATAGCVSTYGL